MMKLEQLLLELKRRNITLELKDGQIAVPPYMLTNPLRAAIIAHKPELIRHLQAESAPAAAPSIAECKVPGAIRLQYVLDWFKQATRKIPMAGSGRQKARLPLPTRCRWLIGWLPEPKRVELEAKGDLAWTDWNDVMGDVRGKFEKCLKL